jgi:alginate O-acetyltransferase complex protein AlgI
LSEAAEWQCDMVFSSLIFVHIFLPLLLVCYFSTLAMTTRIKSNGTAAINFVLLLSSIGFYAWGEGSRAWVLAMATVVSFIAGLLVAPTPDGTGVTRRSVVLISAVAIELSLLIYFKYAGLLVSVLPDGDSTRLWRAWASEITLPLGISFFTFQTLSYVVDVYRGDVRPSRNLLDYSLFVYFFPQLVAGPIVRYEQLSTALEPIPEWSFRGRRG